jgi:hypothetical protein
MDSQVPGSVSAAGTVPVQSTPDAPQSPFAAFGVLPLPDPLLLPPLLLELAPLAPTAFVAVLTVEEL